MREEEKLGGHAIMQHVNANPEYLATRVREEAQKIIDRGNEFEGLSIGSFTTLMAATKLVNSTISRNQEMVDQVAQGNVPFAILNGRFDSPTGYESYLPSQNAQSYMRGTYGVRVFILRDVRAKKGYRVESAFPIK